MNPDDIKILNSTIADLEKLKKRANCVTDCANECIENLRMILDDPEGYSDSEISEILTEYTDSTQRAINDFKALESYTRLA